MLQAVATCHGFTDGNKRTAVLLTTLLLEESGYRLVPADTDEDLDVAIEEFVLAVVAHRLTFEEMVAWFKVRVERLS